MLILYHLIIFENHLVRRFGYTHGIVRLLSRKIDFCLPYFVVIRCKFYAQYGNLVSKPNVICSASVVD